MLPPPHSCTDCKLTRADRCWLLHTPCTDYGSGCADRRWLLRAPCIPCVADRANICTASCASLRTPCASDTDPAVLTDAGTSTLFAPTTDPSVLTDTCPSALLAATALPSVRTFVVLLRRCLLLPPQASSNICRRSHPISNLCRHTVGPYLLVF